MLLQVGRIENRKQFADSFAKHFEELEKLEEFASC